MVCAIAVLASAAVGGLIPIMEWISSTPPKGRK